MAERNDSFSGTSGDHRHYRLLHQYLSVMIVIIGPLKCCTLFQWGEFTQTILDCWTGQAKQDPSHLAIPDHPGVRGCGHFPSILASYQLGATIMALFCFAFMIYDQCFFGGVVPSPKKRYR
uniref:Uncharacterized protein n=1 Tax=Anopheles culicifacies TaxID=139723 RepID=A0A182M0U1_9DIPT